MVSIFICTYGYFFIKKMDLFLFPYNAMFWGASTQKKSPDVYVVKVNGNIVPITHQFYWKKDMLEQAATHYALYKTKGNMVYLSEYIDQKEWPVSIKQTLKNKLTPGEIDFQQWAGWYLTKTCYPVKVGDTVSICRLEVEMRDDKISFMEKQVVEQVRWSK